MSINYLKLNKFPLKSIENIISAKLKKYNNQNSKRKKIVKKALNSVFTKKFSGLALDFDGTLIPLEERDNIVDPIIIHKLKLLNKKKIPIFILTGRGNSIMRQFPLSDFTFRNYIIIAQYNGGRITNGNNDLIYQTTINSDENYNEIKNFLVENCIKFVEKTAGFVCYEKDDAYSLCESFIREIKNWRILTTNFNFDILPSKISKGLALQKICKLFDSILIESILKIGDSGDINGNDYDYLKLKNSFSVGEFSSDLSTNFPIVNVQNIYLKGPKGLNFILNHLIL